MNDLTEEEADAQIVLLEKQLEQHRDSVEKSRQRSQDWNQVARHQNGLVASVSSDIARIKAGNIWKRTLDYYEYNNLLAEIVKFEEYRNDILKERNITEAEFLKAKDLIYRIKISALRIVRDLDEKHKKTKSKIASEQRG